MKRALRIVATLPGIMFTLIGLRWLVEPSAAAAELGMPLLDGVGRSTQIGDMAAFFLVLGAMVLIGVITLERTWFYASAMLLGAAAICRILAWLFHGAPLPSQMIAPEIIIASLLLLASAKLTKNA